MKKILLILILPIFLMSCSFTSGQYITITFAEGAASRTAVSDLGSINQVELWISDTGVNFYLTDDPLVVLEVGVGETDVTSLLDNDINNPVTGTLNGVEDVAETEAFDSERVWYKSVNTNGIDFFINTGLTKNFTVKVTYDGGEVFLGSSQRTINSFTNTIEIEVVQTATSLDEQVFETYNDFIQTDFE